MTEHYRMNPAEDMILTGDELRDGMLVLPECWTMRQPHDEQSRMRRDQFREVTRLHKRGHLVIFLGQWDDGYQETHTYARDYTWLVKKGTLPWADLPPQEPVIFTAAGPVPVSDLASLTRLRELLSGIKHMLSEYDLQTGRKS